MNKFDIEYNKILKKENIIQQNLIEQYSLKQFGQDTLNLGKRAYNAGKTVATKAANTISSIGSNIANAVSKGVTWTIEKIKSTLQKLWDLLTPDNAQQTAKNTKALINIMPDSIAKQAKRSIEVAESPQFKVYIQQQIKKQYKTIENFNNISVQDKKKFIKRKTEQYINANNIISQEIIDQAIGIIGVTVCIAIISLLIGGLGLLGKWIYDDSIDQSPEARQRRAAKNKKEMAKTNLEKAKIETELAIEKAKYEQWKNDQQRQKIFQQIINVSVFQ